ncbi:peptidylprolyl isomerase [Parendozoicomonas haliclonae]|uniref:Peptidyl-prolyl cis-trans isomerase n=1 Tax=Parendozoicomonas haliclonae TaxID=1960125 RepID=A0A1X7AP38_9GAMM|nr:peptidylprolyl isomerase [Parendozoicomonas haliclonae]SMA49849.1 Peptidyl-prolyl cis-trans isomerase A precursor [Parendozoicomonas haliclonae]
MNPVKKFMVLAGLALTTLSFQLMAAPVVVMETNLGSVEIELNEEKAPISSKNFLSYAEKGFYNGTIFHRVIPGFMAQGGGFTEDMNQKNTDQPIKNESTNGLLNTRGTLAMARTPHPDSATSQFFINLVDNPFLDGKSYKPGYAVFGKVTKGMEVIDKMALAPTGNKGMHQNVPVEAIVIKSMTVKTSAAQ